jgi:DNA-binding NarL/FixJ family response regulator
VARLVVEAAGFEVAGEAADGFGALAAAADTDPDVVLLDMRLPGLDGIAVAEALASRKSPPVVVLTSSADVGGYAERIAAASVRGVIPKERLTARALADLLTGTPRD